MSSWTVSVTGTLSDTIVVKADSEAEARERAIDAFAMFFDITDTEFELGHEWENISAGEVKAGTHF